SGERTGDRLAGRFLNVSEASHLDFSGAHIAAVGIVSFRRDYGSRNGAILWWIALVATRSGKSFVLFFIQRYASANAQIRLLEHFPDTVELASLHRAVRFAVETRG